MRFLPVRRQSQELEATRTQTDFSLDGYMQYLNELIYNGNAYFTQGAQQTQPGQKQEVIGPAYRAITELAYKSDSVVFACMQTRARHFNQGRFQFRRLNNGRPGDYFGTADLVPLEVPWVSGTTQSLLTRMIMHVDLGGNAFVVRRGDGVALLRPDWVSIVIGSDADAEMGAWATDAEVLGYVYSPGGYGSGYETETYAADEVAHFAPLPDPEARFRGMSWLTPLIREVMADKAATEHKLKFFENPTPNMVVKFDVPDLEQMKAQVKAFKEAHMGPRNAFKWMFTSAGVDATPVGSNMQDLDYRLVTGAGETRIAAAAGTPPVLVGLSEGLQGSSLNAGNYQAARRNFADGVIIDLWNAAAGCLANIITVPAGAELATDPRGIPFLQEDAVEQADILQKESITIRYLVDAGYKPDTVIQAVTSHDLSLLEHSGLFSVQLQAANAPKQGLFTGAVVPNDASSPQGEAAAANGSSSTNGKGRSGDVTMWFDRIDDAREFSDRVNAAAAIAENGALTLPEIEELKGQSPAIAAGKNGNGSTNGKERSTADIHEVMSSLRGLLDRGDTHIHFDEGSFVLPASPDLHIHEGAIRNEVTTPDVHVDAPITVEPATVEIAERAFVSETTIEPAQVTVEAAPTPDVNVTVEPAQVTVEAAPPANITIEPTRIEEGAIHVDVAPAEVEVTVERSGKRRIDYGDGRSAVVTDGEARRIDFDDGESVTITELPEADE